MDIKDVFAKMKQKLNQLGQQYAHNELERAEFEKELYAFQQESEMILEEWIDFEDQLANYIHPQIKLTFGEQGAEGSKGPVGEQEPAGAHVSTNAPGSVTASDLMVESGPADGVKSTDASKEAESPEWKEGKAWYDLHLFSRAIGPLENVLAKDPEFDAARLYLAHAYLANSQTDKARYHLQFLIDTAEQEDIGQLATHALACLQGTVGDYEQANHFFQKIDVDQVREKWKPIVIYNHAQTLYQLRLFEESKHKFAAYYRLVPEDWKGLFMLGKIHHQLGDEERGFGFWFEALQRQENPHLLQAMAKQFEQKAYYRMAAQCYERMMKAEDRCTDEQVWYGLAWNYGLAGEQDNSRRTFMKALSLFPGHLPLQISYAWMLLLWDDKEKAQKAIDNLQQHGKHPLVQALTNLQAGEYRRTQDYLEQVNAH